MKYFIISSAIIFLFATCEPPFTPNPPLSDTNNFSLTLEDFFETDGAFSSIYPALQDNIDNFEIELYDDTGALLDSKMSRNKTFYWTRIQPEPLRLKIKGSNKDGVIFIDNEIELDGGEVHSGFSASLQLKDEEGGGFIKLPVELQEGSGITKITASITNTNFSILDPPISYDIDITNITSNKVRIDFDNAEIPSGSYLLHMRFSEGGTQKAYVIKNLTIMAGLESGAWVDEKGALKEKGVKLTVNDLETAKNALYASVDSMPLFYDGKNNFYLSEELGGNEEVTITFVTGGAAFSIEKELDENVSSVAVTSNTVTLQDRDFDKLKITVDTQIYYLYKKPSLKLVNKTRDALFYDSLDEAVKNADGGNNIITLLNDITIEETIIINDIITLTVPREKSYSINRAADFSDTLFRVGHGGRLTLEANANSVITLDGKEINAASPLIEIKGGNLFLNKGSILKNNYNILGKGGALYISGGYTEINGASISSNSAAKGGAIYAEKSFCLSGSSLIKNDNDVYLSEKTAIHILSAITPERNTASCDNNKVCRITPSIYPAANEKIPLLINSGVRNFENYTAKFSITPRLPSGGAQYSILKDGSLAVE